MPVGTGAGRRCAIADNLRAGRSADAVGNGFSRPKRRRAGRCTKIADVFPVHSYRLNGRRLLLPLIQRPPKQKQQHQKIVASLKKNDKVRTIGGIIGTIVDIDGEIITLKVDEANNTKIKVVSSAICRSMTEGKD